MAKDRPLCRLCKARHFSYEPHKIVGYDPHEPKPEPQKAKKSKDGPLAIEPANHVMLTNTEARTLTNRIKSAFEDIRGRVEETARMLHDVYEREGWKALGYSSWKLYIESEFAITKRHAYRLVGHQAFLAAINPKAGKGDQGSPTNESEKALAAEKTTRRIRGKKELVREVRKRVRKGESPESAIEDVAARQAEIAKVIDAIRTLASTKVDFSEIEKLIPETPGLDVAIRMAGKWLEQARSGKR